jgi:hypothetical protein
MERIVKYLALLSVYFFIPIFINLITIVLENEYAEGIAAIVFLLLLLYINSRVAYYLFRILLLKQILFGIITTTLALFLTYQFSMLNIFPRQIDRSGKLTLFFINGIFSLFIWEILYKLNKQNPNHANMSNGR